MKREERKFILEFCAETVVWRKDLSLTQADLAQRIEMSPSWVAMMEHGAILPEYQMRKKIRLALEGEEFQRAVRRRKRSAESVTKDAAKNDGE